MEKILYAAMCAILFLCCSSSDESEANSQSPFTLHNNDCCRHAANNKLKLFSSFLFHKYSPCLSVQILKHVTSIQKLHVENV